MAESAAAAAPAAEEDAASIAIRQRLYDASREGDVARATAALDEGADVNSWDPWGIGPLQSAALGGHVAVAALLLERRADPDAMSKDGKSALHIAATSGHADLAVLIISHGADVLLRSGHGSTALDLAKLQNPRGACTQSIAAEMSKRLREAEETTEKLRRRLDCNDQVRADLRAQLVPPAGPDASGAEAPESLLPDGESAEAGGNSSASGGAATLGYWGFVAQKVDHFRGLAETGLARAALRVPPPASADAFSWIGRLEARRENILPILDPEDQELRESFYRLGLAVDDSEKRLGRGSAEAAASADPEADRHLVEQTGRDMLEWEKVVVALRSAGGLWDWSRVQVRNENPEEIPAGVGGYPVAFATCLPDMDPEEPVFRHKEVIGPLGGTLFRRGRYERLRRPGGGPLGLHDPSAYEFKLHAKTPELRIETLVLDLSIGPSANRLRHLADARADPLRLQTSLLASSGSQGVFASPECVIPVRRYGDSMPKPRSRPSSPRHGDGGKAAAEAVAAQLAEEAARAAEVSASESVAEEEQRRVVTDTKNAQILEVLVQGWPYAFVVATRDINAGERIAIDRGESYWALQRAALARIQAMGRIGADLATGVDLERKDGQEDAQPPPVTLPARAPMKRPQV